MQTHAVKRMRTGQHFRASQQRGMANATNIIFWTCFHWQHLALALGMIYDERVGNLQMPKNRPLGRDAILQKSLEGWLCRMHAHPVVQLVRDWIRRNGGWCPYLNLHSNRGAATFIVVITDCTITDCKNISGRVIRDCALPIAKIFVTGAFAIASIPIAKKFWPSHSRLHHSWL